MSGGAVRLVVAEKPSVARDLARVLGCRARRDGYLEGDGLRITWCRGHLLELVDPERYRPEWKTWRLEALPMLPETFALDVREGAEEQWEVVRRLLQDRSVRDVVNACDAGREGELIFRQVYEHAGCRRPVLRLWTSSMTDEALQRAWRELVPGERFDALADAARCRSEADWLVGINATRAMTLRNRERGGDGLLSVGRVQTPTLAMIVGRDEAIEAFTPETYWKVEARLAAAAGSWSARFTRQPTLDVSKARQGKEEEEPTEVERLASESDAEKVAAALAGRPGEVVGAERREVRDRPPLLYDLTALQRRANQRYGLSADRTLEIAQALYERHKLLTYPRTDARFLSGDVARTLPEILRAVAGVGVYAPMVEAIAPRAQAPGDRVVNDAEVGDHHAILPTDRSAAGARLSVDEKRVYDLVVRRLLAALAPDARFATTVLVVAVQPEDPGVLPDDVSAPLHLQARGRVCLDEGWQAYDPPRRRRDHDLPLVEVSDPVEVSEVEVKEGATRPPRPHDDASILKAMETAGRDLDEAALRRALRGAGLGTPATRASILQTLLSRRYIVRDKRHLRSTPAGRALIHALPAQELRDAEMTGRWEQRLSEMADGTPSRGAFMRDVAEHVRVLVQAISTGEAGEVVEGPAREKGPSLGDCPCCGAPVRVRGPVYTCDTGRSCPFVIFGTMSGRKISARMVKQVMASGRSDVVKGFRSRRTGKDFSAGLLLREDGTVGLYFPDDPDPARPAPAADPPSESSPEARPGSEGPVGMSCPACRAGRLVAGRAAWGCSRWREGCEWRLPFSEGGRALSAEEARRRVRRAQRASQSPRGVDNDARPTR